MDRFFVDDAEFRAAVPEGNRVAGHASVFGQVAQIRGGFERIDPAAFDRALREGQEVVLLVNHEGLPLGTTASGTLRLGTDKRGLTVDADLPETTLGQDVRVLLAAGLLRKMSFGFIPKADRIDVVRGRQVRTITDVDLFDVSIVTVPAYSGTDVALRSMDFDSLPELEPDPPTTPRPPAWVEAARIRARRHESE
jgi:HK97 family phage prohead protease